LTKNTISQPGTPRHDNRVHLPVSEVTEDLTLDFGALVTF